MALSCWLALAAAAPAKTFKANRTGDPAPGKCTRKHCTLREAVEAATDRAGADLVQLAPGKRYELTIPPGVGPENDSGDLFPETPLRIETRRRKSGKPKRATIDANGIDRIIDAQDPLTLRGVVLTGGESSDCGAIDASGGLLVDRSRVAGNHSDVNGGGICSFGGPTTIRRSDVIGNEAGNIGGGAQIYGRLKVTGSTFRGNEADSIGGGLGYVGDDRVVVRDSRFVKNTAGTGGGIGALSIGLEACVALTVQRSSLDGNSAFGGGGLFAGCLANTVDASTIAGNEAENGGGVQIGGETTLTNSTIAGNEAVGTGGGISSANFDLALRSTTVAGNGAGVSGGGVSFSGAGVDARVRNVLIALNTAGSSAPDCGGTFSSQGGNLLADDANCAGFDEPSDQVDPQPKLGKLKRNGGPTKTMALRKGSPAINEGVKPAPKRDQRGVKRAGKPDVGAYELARRR